mmetsp:Transcript_2568/g.4189  ORF Transcript_2568/g.4189 Transcript_2568/m.4189 type:complete len:210 (-) Transcript_2568:203-832(-)
MFIFLRAYKALARFLLDCLLKACSFSCDRSLSNKGGSGSSNAFLAAKKSLRMFFPPSTLRYCSRILFPSLAGMRRGKRANVSITNSMSFPDFSDSESFRRKQNIFSKPSDLKPPPPAAPPLLLLQLLPLFLFSPASSSSPSIFIRLCCERSSSLYMSPLNWFTSSLSSFPLLPSAFHTCDSSFAFITWSIKSWPPFWLPGVDISWPSWS